ncbi:helix-turn-helix transcriptional regulator [Nocardioides sp.]|uniref:helix-turn-helix transcriptional regulator n=1 Tax=Nocardioides sp. TaxID=35761 RepID=UPI00272103BA|nr:helix-turn-helix transcriptional regulator [Nocardioides sp.]MDO9455012.1 helix-turn-helix transcriptional regulator [Nocardioides sp.]
MDEPWTWVLDPAELGSAIRRARNSHGWDQAELAERLGVTRMTLSRVERGHAGSVDTALRALAECGYGVVVAPRTSRVSVDAPDGS